MPDQQDHVEVKSFSLRTSTFILFGILLVSAICLSFVYFNFPNLEPEEKAHFKLPKSLDEAKALGKVLHRYKDRYYYVVLFGFNITYIFLQSFAIPGSIFLSILSGFLFPFPLSILCVCTCSAVGASICFLLSMLFGRPFILRYWPEKTAEWSAQVAQHRGHLLWYIIFLRITPFLPNWFINITSPILNVPLVPFFFGTFIGVGPPSFFAIYAGTTLNELAASSQFVISYTSIMWLCVAALASLIPVIFTKKLENKLKPL